MEDAVQVTAEDTRIIDLSSWLIEAGLLGTSRIDMLEAYCRKLIDLEVPVLRVHVTQTALHPVYGGVGFNWKREEGHADEQYAHTQQAPENWFNSPFYYMMSNGLAEYRETLGNTDPTSRFPLLEEQRANGAKDYFAMALLYDAWDPGTPIDFEDQVDGVLMSWMSDADGGFSDADLILIRETFPVLGLVLKSGAHRKTANDLLGVYLGGDAGQRVLSGEIQRGTTQWIDAVICYFDFEGFTALSQELEGEALIAMLNDYFAVVVEQIDANGGNVLKFMGDGMLAIFDREQLDDAPDRALRATQGMSRDIAALSRARKDQGLPTFNYTMALHAGQVLYGNIGADTRLDFTVIGPEVNLTARIGDMHRSLGQRVILSGTLAQEVKDSQFDLVSLGRYMMRGVARPQELFTIYVDTPEPSLDAEEG